MLVGDHTQNSDSNNRTPNSKAAVGVSCPPARRGVFINFAGVIDLFDVIVLLVLHQQAFLDKKRLAGEARSTLT